MHRPRDQLFSRAALAQDQHRHLSVRDASDPLAKPIHRGALADQSIGPCAVEGELAQGAVLHQQMSPLEGSLDVEKDLLQLERLRQIMFGTSLHRLDCRFDVAKRGHDQHRNVPVGAAGVLENVETVDVFHAQVGNDHVGQRGVDRLDRRSTRRSDLHDEVVVLELLGEQFDHLDVVIDYEDASVFGRHRVTPLDVATRCACRRLARQFEYMFRCPAPTRGRCGHRGSERSA